MGCGAEIGANLLIQNDPAKDGFIIQTVVTNPPSLDKHYPELRPIDGIVARLAMALPGVQAHIQIINSDTLQIDGREVRFFFGDLARELPRRLAVLTWVLSRPASWIWTRTAL